MDRSHVALALITYDFNTLVQYWKGEFAENGQVCRWHKLLMLGWRNEQPHTMLSFI